jgi:hypothetical protein
VKALGFKQELNAILAGEDPLFHGILLKLGMVVSDSSHRARADLSVWTPILIRQ